MLSLPLLRCRGELLPAHRLTLLRVPSLWASVLCMSEGDAGDFGVEQVGGVWYVKTHSFSNQAMWMATRQQVMSTGTGVGLLIDRRMDRWMDWLIDYLIDYLID